MFAIGTVAVIFVIFCITDTVHWLKGLRYPRKRPTKTQPIRPWHIANKKLYKKTRKKVLAEEKRLYRSTTVHKKWYWKILP